MKGASFPDVVESLVVRGEGHVRCYHIFYTASQILVWWWLAA